MAELDRRTHYPLSVDCVIFGYADGALKVALIERKMTPFKGDWAIPGGFLIENETVEEAAFRELREETGISDIYLEQFQVFSEPERDPIFANMYRSRAELKGGRLILNDEPGFGFTIDWDYVKRYAA